MTRTLRTRDQWTLAREHALISEGVEAEVAAVQADADAERVFWVQR